MPGFQELIVIAVVALLVFGPDRLPELARNAGRWVGRFRSATQRNVDELNSMSEIQELQTELRQLRREFDRAQPGAGSGMSGRAGSRRPATPRTGGANAGRGATGLAAGLGGATTFATRPDDLPAPTDPDTT